MSVLTANYKRCYNRDLKNDLKLELNGNNIDVIVSLVGKNKSSKIEIFEFFEFFKLKITINLFTEYHCDLQQDIQNGEQKSLGRIFRIIASEELATYESNWYTQLSGALETAPSITTSNNLKVDISNAKEGVFGRNISPESIESENAHVRLEIQKAEKLYLDLVDITFYVLNKVFKSLEFDDFWFLLAQITPPLDEYIRNTGGQINKLLLSFSHSLCKFTQYHFYVNSFLLLKCI